MIEPPIEAILSPVSLSNRSKILFEDDPVIPIPKLELPEKINSRQLQEIKDEIGDIFDKSLEETGFALAGVMQTLVEKI